MTTNAPPRLYADDLRRLPAPALTPPDCACAHLSCAGWESVSAQLREPLLRRLGTLRNPDDEDPTVQELHLDGSRYGSPHAPVAPDWYPYNRCDVWACAACGRGFLQYTEFGGYYIDHRLREVDPARVV
ncbi:hypothetical protein [Piscinibacter sakaiensis]|uniref:hypothetical protein n=1 Tax=Piscinibacter sakaiensis TaxID=1547922 RepID=UPI003AAD7F37